VRKKKTDFECRGEKKNYVELKKYAGRLFSFFNVQAVFSSDFPI